MLLNDIKIIVQETFDNSYNINNITNCFDKYYGKNVEEVKRNNQILSVIRKIEKK